MNNIWTLVKLNFHKELKIFNLDVRGKNGLKNILLSLGLVILLLPLYFSYLKNIWLSYDFFIELKLDLAYFQTAILLVQSIIIVFSLPKILNSFYYDTDIDQLITLPLSSKEIIFSKIISLVLGEYIKVLIFFSPFIFTYGIKGQAGLGFYLYSLIVTALIPLMPVGLNIILIMVFMRFTNIGKKKDLIRGLGMVVLTFIIIFIQVYIQKKALTSPLGGGDIFQILGATLMSLSKFLKKYMPLSLITSKILYNYMSFKGFLFLLLEFLLTNIFLLILLYISKSLYMKGLLDGNTSSFIENKKQKKLSYKKEKIYITLAKKEFRILFRNPIFFLNSVMGSLMIPIILGISISIDKTQAKELSNLCQKNSFIALVFFVVIILFSNLSGVSPTSFSREGKNYWIQKQLPIRAEDQAKGRILVGGTMVVLTSLVVGVVGKFILDMENVIMFLVVFYGIILSLPLVNIGLVLDIKNPKLDWSTPEEAMKQNSNVLKNMGLILGYILFLGLLVIGLYKFTSIRLIYFIIIFLALVLSYFTYKKLVKTIEYLMNN